MVRSKNGIDWEILEGACLELSATQWANKPEFCPTLSHIVESDVILPGIASRDAVQAEIDRMKVIKVHV